jgi:hypothetical protein
MKLISRSLPLLLILLSSVHAETQVKPKDFPYILVANLPAEQSTALIQRLAGLMPEYQSAPDEFARNEILPTLVGRVQKRVAEWKEVKEITVALPAMLGQYNFNSLSFPITILETKFEQGQYWNFGGGMLITLELGGRISATKVPVGLGVAEDLARSLAAKGNIQRACTVLLTGPYSVKAKGGYNPPQEASILINATSMKVLLPDGTLVGEKTAGALAFPQLKVDTLTDDYWGKPVVAALVKVGGEAMADIISPYRREVKGRVRLNVVDANAYTVSLTVLSLDKELEGVDRVGNFKDNQGNKLPGLENIWFDLSNNKF